MLHFLVLLRVDIFSLFKLSISQLLNVLFRNCNFHFCKSSLLKRLLYFFLLALNASYFWMCLDKKCQLHVFFRQKDIFLVKKRLAL